MIVADPVRAARKENAGEDGYVEAGRILMQEAVFGGKFDVAHPDIDSAARGVIIAGRQGRRELKVGPCAVIEIDTGLTPRTVAGIRSIVKRIDLELAVGGRLRIVGHEGRTRSGRLCQQD